MQLLAHKISSIIVTDYLPASIANMSGLVGTIVGTNSSAIIEQISELRDYAECERYRKKEEVDDYLKSSPETIATCRQIEILFEKQDAVVAATQYLELFQAEMAALHNFHVRAMYACAEYSINEWRTFWEELVPLADRDNAHAMYLSSDNWPFSVFHRIIAELEQLVGVGDFGPILTAGIQDARTFVYETSGGTMIGISRVDCVKHLVSSNSFILPNGVMPLFTFEAATKTGSKVNGLKSSAEILRRFQVAVETQAGRLPVKQIERFLSLIRVYQRLYAARAAYDIYEYFGCYAFLRHYLILKCASSVKFKRTNDAQLFKRAAATYQFGKAMEILENRQVN